MGMMGQLDGQKAQVEQTAASSRGGKSASLDAKDMDDGESQEDSIKPYPWSAGEEDEKPDAYGMFNGGVTDNYKPQELRDARDSIDIFDNAFDKIGQITGKSDPIEIIANIEWLTDTSGVIDADSVWGQAAAILADAQEETGMTYQGALDLFKQQQTKYENQKRYDKVVEHVCIYEYATMLVEDITGGDSIDWTFPQKLTLKRR